jgi:hypothetical protein
MRRPYIQGGRERIRIGRRKDKKEGKEDNLEKRAR